MKNNFSKEHKVMETEVSDSNAVFIYEPVELMQIHHSGNLHF